MDPAELHNDYLRERFNAILEESARQRELPSLRQRLALRLQSLVDWLEPAKAPAPQRDPGSFQKRTTA